MTVELKVTSEPRKKLTRDTLQERWWWRLAQILFALVYIIGIVIIIGFTYINILDINTNDQVIDCILYGSIAVLVFVILMEVLSAVTVYILTGHIVE